MFHFVSVKLKIKKNPKDLCVAHKDSKRNGCRPTYLKN